MCEVILYHTEACHLCELAQTLLDQCETNYRKKDIIEDDALVDLYGSMIPVIKYRQTGAVIHWPFDIDGLQQWLTNNR